MKALISGYYGFGNFGDEMILSCLTSHLKSNGVEVSVLSSNPKVTSVENGVNAYNSFDFKSLPEIIAKHDVLISGGGSLLQDVTSKKSLIYYLGVIFLALAMRKKVVIFAQGIGPINDPFLRLVTKTLLKCCTYVSVRDEKSFDLLKSWKVDCEQLCDPIFSLKLPEYNPQDIVGVQLREFATLKDEALQKLANKIVNDFSDKKIQLFSFQDSIDLAVSRKFAEMLKALKPEINVEILYNLMKDEIIEKISHLDYIFAMRFHALIIALMYGVKSCAINYDIKVEKLAHEAGIPLLEMNFDCIEKIEFKTTILKHDFDWSEIDNIIN